MTGMPNRDDQIYDLEQALLEFPGSEWAERLREACPNDPELAAEVLDRLSTLDDAADEAPAIHVPGEVARDDDTVADPLVGQAVGPYRLLRRLPEQGAMGTVYQAVREDEHLSGQLVVIKVLRPGLTDRRFLQRFNFERTVLARLSHPGIVRVFDAGTLGDGRPYYVMECIEQALPLDAYCRQHALPVSQRLATFRRVCAAVSHAHQQRVLHRDLKPANILVTPDGEPKILDFGLAKLLEMEQGSSFSLAGEWVGTPDYASPEQVRGETLTEQSDQYSLGVILFELLAGRPPYRLPAISEGAWAAVINTVANTEPARPSAVVSGEARQSGVHATKVRGDLDAIVLRCLRKEASFRYRSVAELSEDIDRFLAGRPVRARLPTVSYRLVKFTRRHPLPVVVGALAIISLTAAFLLTRQAHQAAMQTQAKALLRAATEAFDKDPTTAATLLASIGPEVEPEGGRALGSKLLITPLATIIRTNGGAPTDAIFSPDGERIAVASADGVVRVWNASGEGLPLMLAGHQGPVTSVRFSTDGRSLLTASADGTARVWRLQSPQSPIVLDGRAGAVRHAEFGADGTVVITASADRVVRVWRSNGTGQPLVLGADASDVMSLGVSPDGQRLVTGSADGRARVWWTDAHASPVVLMGHRGSVNAAAFSSRDDTIATAGDDGTVRVWRTDGRCVRTLAVTRAPLKVCAFDASGSRVVAGAADGSVPIVDVESGAVRLLPAHRGPITSVQFSSRGAVLTASEDADARLWGEDGTSEVLDGHEGPVRIGRFSPDGRRVVTASADGTARIWSLYQTPSDAAETMLANPAPRWRELVETLRSRVRSCLTVAERRHYLGEGDQEARHAFAACEASHNRTPDAEKSGVVFGGVRTLAAILEEPIPASSIWRVDSQRVTTTGCVLEITRKFTLIGKGEKRSFWVRLDLSGIEDGRVRHGADEPGLTEVERQQDYVSLRTIGGSRTIEFRMFDAAGSQIDSQFWNVLTTEVNPAAKDRASSAMKAAIAACRTR